MVELLRLLLLLVLEGAPLSLGWVPMPVKVLGAAAAAVVVVVAGAVEGVAVVEVGAAEVLVVVVVSSFFWPKLPKPPVLGAAVEVGVEDASFFWPKLLKRLVLGAAVEAGDAEVAAVPEDAGVEAAAVSSFFCPRLEKKLVDRKSVV